MTSKVRSVLVAIGYALVGAALVGGVGVVIGYSVAPDDGLQAVFNAAVGALVGGVVGGILGVVLFVAGTKAVERQTQTIEHQQTQGSKR